VNVPLSVFFFWMVLGMATTMSVWLTMPDEIEGAIGMEDEDMQPALRVFLTVVFVLAWPLVLVEMIRR
jgi:hypothetical protein